MVGLVLSFSDKLKKYKFLTKTNKKYNLFPIHMRVGLQIPYLAIHSLCIQKILVGRGRGIKTGEVCNRLELHKSISISRNINGSF